MKNYQDIMQTEGWSSLFKGNLVNVIHVAPNKSIEVSILALQKYEYPVLVCAICEVLTSLAGEDKSNMPSLILLFIPDTSKTMLERKYSADECVYGIQIGPPTELRRPFYYILLNLQFIKKLCMHKFVRNPNCLIML